MKRMRVVVTVAALLWAGSTLATETITYSYDVKGRVAKAGRSGTVNIGVTTDYAHDKADNRKNVKTTGSANSPPS